MSDSAPQPDPELGTLEWVSVEIGDGQHLHVLDCRSIALTMMSTTTDPEVVSSFSRLRTSDGRQHVGQVPPDSLVIECGLEYEGWPLQGNGALFKADEMEEKWDVYQWGGELYVARSWTGDLIFTATLDVQGTRASILRVVAAAERVFGDACTASRFGWPTRIRMASHSVRHNWNTRYTAQSTSMCGPSST